MQEVKTFLRQKNTESAAKHTIPNNSYFYASEALKCPRQIYYSRKFPQAPDDKLLGVFYVGETIHEMFQGILKEAKADLKDEVEIRIKMDDIEVSGRADLMGDNEILELKTTADVKYNKDEASTHHIGQLTLYMSQHRDKKGTLVYIDKRNLETVEHQIEFDQMTFDAVMNNFKKAKIALDTDKLPLKPGYVDAWQCKYCNYKDKCDAEMKTRTMDLSE